MDGRNDLLRAAQAAQEPAQSYDSVPLGPGECDFTSTTFCPPGQDCHATEQVVCRGEAASVPLGGAGLPLGLALVGSAFWLSRTWRRGGGSGPRVARGLALGLGGLCLLTLGAESSQALRYPDRRRAPCGYVAPLINASYSYFDDFEYAVQEMVDLTGGHFNFRFTRAGETDSNFFWSERDLPGTSLGSSVARLGRNGHITRCEIKLDAEANVRAAELQGADPTLFRAATWKHEMGHCMGLEHFRCPPPHTQCSSIGVTSVQEAKSVMNYSLWSYVNDSNLSRWNEWYRYANGEGLQVWDDVVGQGCPP